MKDYDEGSPHGAGDQCVTHPEPSPGVTQRTPSPAQGITLNCQPRNSVDAKAETLEPPGPTPTSTACLLGQGLMCSLSHQASGQKLPSV